jgi:hypothetical protein
MKQDDVVSPIRGWVTMEQFAPDGTLVSFEKSNTFTLAGATLIAKAFAGETADMETYSIATSSGGPRISDCDGTAGFSGSPAPTANSTIYRQGLASLAITTSGPSTTNTVANGTSVASTTAPSGSGIEFSMRIEATARVSLGSSELRIYCNGGTADYYKVTLADVQTLTGTSFADATWKVSRVPIADFSTGAGTPSWSAVTGLGVFVTSTATGAPTIYLDNVFVYRGDLDTANTATSVPNALATTVITDRSRSTRTTTSRALYGANELVGETVYLAGLYADAGSTLIGITSVSAGVYKAIGNTLLVTWALTAQGG